MPDPTVEFEVADIIETYEPETAEDFERLADEVEAKKDEDENGPEVALAVADELRERARKLRFPGPRLVEGS
ncbi:hypothetical protein V7S57_02610 [Caulobacter sp. CCNWLY153]|uniref:hypothetical protein n=1 Tax=unclassified Caulobacter TaxID=2648921 RepID=UPI002FF1DB8E